MRYIIPGILLFFIITTMNGCGEEDESSFPGYLVFATVKEKSVVRVGDESHGAYKIGIKESVSESLPRGSVIDILWKDTVSAVTPFRRARPKIDNDYLLAIQEKRGVNGNVYSLYSPSMAYDSEMFSWPPAENVNQLLKYICDADLIVAVTVISVFSEQDGTVEVDVEIPYKHIDLKNLFPTGPPFGTITVKWGDEAKWLETGDRFILFLNGHDSVPQHWELVEKLEERMFRWPPSAQLIERITTEP